MLLAPELSLIISPKVLLDHCYKQAIIRHAEFVIILALGDTTANDNYTRVLRFMRPDSNVPAKLTLKFLQKYINKQPEYLNFAKP